MKNKILEHFKHVKFIEKGHKYLIGDKAAHTSVSQYCTKFKPPFNAKAAAIGVAKKRTRETGITVWPQVIEEEWKNAGIKAANEGTAVHKALEDYVNHGLFGSKHPKAIAGKAFIDDCLKLGFEPVLTEIIVYDPVHNIAGQVDLLMKFQNVYILMDYKTNKDLNKAYGKLYKPFDHLSSNGLNYYSIQLSIYQDILEQVEDLKIAERWIISLRDDETYKVHKTDKLNIPYGGH